MKDMIRLIAELLAGTQVPRSMGVLGKGQEPWDEIRDRLKLCGYPTIEQHEIKLRESFAILGAAE